MTELFGDSAAPAQALARKWRPRAFADLRGQEHVVQALSNALTQGRLHHAYLLTGTRGVGKTTLARILAKCLNCETGVTATPCGECSACRQIDAGRFVDLIELDAASNTGVDNMREVLDNAQYAPTVGRFKVYIIDEVHMLSKSAFNSMLKTLEEPPAHVKFVLATTDPQKIPVTVLSRCLQFNLKPMPPALVARHLGDVLAAESVAAEPAALELLARAAAGSMRDALSLTDQAIAYGGGALTAAEVDAMLGNVGRDHLYALLDALAAQDGNALMQHAQTLAERGIAFDSTLQDLAHLLTRLAIRLAGADSGDDPDAPRREAACKALDAETVQLYYQIALAGRRDLPYAPDEYAGFCMTLLRMLAFAPGAAGGAGSGSAGSGSVGLDSAARAAAQRPAATAAAAGAPAVQSTAPPLRGDGANQESEDGHAAECVPPTTVPSTVHAPATRLKVADSGAPTAVPRARAAAPVQGAAPLHAEPDTVAAPVPSPPVVPPASAAQDWDWHAVSSSLTGMAKMLADHCECVSEPGGVLLRVDAAHRHLLDRMYQDKLVAALRERHGTGFAVRFEAGEPAAATPQQARNRARSERQREAAEAIEADPFIRTLVTDFGGRVDPASIQPLGDPA